MIKTVKYLSQNKNKSSVEFFDNEFNISEVKIDLLKKVIINHLQNLDPHGFSVYNNSQRLTKIEYFSKLIFHFSNFKQAIEIIKVSNQYRPTTIKYKLHFLNQHNVSFFSIKIDNLKYLESEICSPTIEVSCEKKAPIISIEDLRNDYLPLDITDIDIGQSINFDRLILSVQDGNNNYSYKYHTLPIQELVTAKIEEGHFVDEKNLFIKTEIQYRKENITIEVSMHDSHFGNRRTSYIYDCILNLEKFDLEIISFNTERG